jgi:hypothetical protein
MAARRNRLQRSPRAPRGGLGWLEVECNRYKTRIRRPSDTIWKLEASLKCRSCQKGRHAPPVRMLKLTERQEITPCKWMHPDEVQWKRRDAIELI